MRFLRFQGQRPKEFRQYLFHHYLRRFSIILVTLLCLLALFPGILLFGLRAAIVTASVYAAFLSALLIRHYLTTRKKTVPDAR